METWSQELCVTGQDVEQEDDRMDYGTLTLEELKKGYSYDSGSDTYICSYCGQCFEKGQVYSMDGNMYLAEPAAVRHVRNIHGGSLSQLIASDTKYNTLTQNQRELLLLISSGMSDKEIAEKCGVSEATIRRQRFTFREKAKQAKFYLAIYEQAFDKNVSADDAIIPLHNNAAYVDDRYLVTEQERQHILETCFSSLDPPVLKNFSAKEKKKVVILVKVAEQFEKGRDYSEKEVNDILKPIYEDYVALRRYLIMYGFMQRTNDGSRYRMTE